MFKRARWTSIGFVLGIGSSWAVTRRLRRMFGRYAPTDAVDRWGGNVRAAVDEGREAMRTREAELKSSLSRNAGH